MYVVMTNKQITEAAPTTYDISPAESVSEAVVTAVASVSDKDPIPRFSNGTGHSETLEPLYSVIDPDALDTLFDTTGIETSDECQVTFEYEGLTVTVENGSQIHVAPAN